jgi:hypothetical protein
MPICKGLFLVLITSAIPLALLILIGKMTSFSMFAYNYDNNSYDWSTLTRLQKGRLSLPLIFSGFYILSAMISRTFKVPNR